MQNERHACFILYERLTAEKLPLWERVLGTHYLKTMLSNEESSMNLICMFGKFEFSHVSGGGGGVCGDLLSHN